MIPVSLLLMAALCPPAAAEIVNDVTRLNPIEVARVASPRSVEEVMHLVRHHPGPVSVGGGRYSMGGQTATAGALYLDMRSMNRMLSISPSERTITVEAGATWRQIQEAIDDHGLSLKIMQSYANFTVGGSLSVNVHGRYVNQGPLIRSVKSIQIVLADGRLVEATPGKNADIFYGAIGGYGGLGVITAATLELEPNDKLERRVQPLRIDEYPRYFQSHIRGSRTAVFHNADIYPPRFESVTAITYEKTDRDVTVPERLRRPGKWRWPYRLFYFAISELPFGKRFREAVADPWRLRGDAVVWRNYEASYDALELEPGSRESSTYALQEYFVPVDRFGEFVPMMREIFQRYGANVLNVSIRHAHKDPGSLLAWAGEECFAFVVYYKQGVQRHQRTLVGLWTRELIDAALAVGGSYYLPYQIHATEEQFHRAYPRAKEFFALKRRLDPRYKFRNKLWDRYFPPPETQSRELELRRSLAARAGYRRPEEQTFLTLPEWHIVHSAEEYASFLVRGLPSGFPYFSSLIQFWRLFTRVSERVDGRYPSNPGYRAMLWTIGASFSVEYAIKGLYERTFGRLAERLFLADSLERRIAEDLFAVEIAREYASFINALPWYDFPFWEKIFQLWSRRGPGRSHPRRFERLAALTPELLLKAAWGGLVKKAAGAAYASEDREILAWVRTGTGGAMESLSGVRVVEKLEGDSWLVALPRHKGFKAAALGLVGRGVRFVEIAGNRLILVVMIAPADWDRAQLWGEVLHEWPILTDPGRKRIALAVAVPSLHLALSQPIEEGIGIDHVHDY
ncbi:MAG: FAD-binding oxidoreductase [Elusimicrobia bacterium]|nr:FAD-binding oxidoreductase [Elusimicrobiota bacterium]